MSSYRTTKITQSLHFLHASQQLWQGPFGYHSHLAHEESSCSEIQSHQMMVMKTARQRQSKAWALGSGCSMYSKKDAGFGARQTSEYQLPSSLAFYLFCVCVGAHPDLVPHLPHGFSSPSAAATHIPSPPHSASSFLPRTLLSGSENEFRISPRERSFKTRRPIWFP